MPPPLKIFIIYAHKDVEFKEELVYHLKPLKMLSLVDTWHDGDLQPGSKWDAEIKNQLRQADIIIPLISTHFINSDYIQGTEFKEARQRWEIGNAEIAPVIVRDCLWDELANLSDLQVLPSDGKKILPVNQWTDRDQAWTIIANEFKKLCVDILESRQRAFLQAQRNKDNAASSIETSEGASYLNNIKNHPSFWRRYRYHLSVGVVMLITITTLLYLMDLSDNASDVPLSFNPGSAKTVSQQQVTPYAFEPEMVFVEGGTFTMGCNPGKDEMACDGDEKPNHQVTLDGFFLGKYETTQLQWRAIMGDNPSFFNNCDSCPVERVSWNQVQAFLKKLSEKTGNKYRLPTEAEWEYAARGGKNSKKFVYSGSNDLDKVGWFRDNSGIKTHPVGEKRGNELGIYDMSGNVFEWCQDWYDTRYYGINAELNPTGPEKDTARVLRGGSWFRPANNSRAANRAGKNPERANNDWGFRVAMDTK